MTSYLKGDPEIVTDKTQSMPTLRIYCTRKFGKELYKPHCDITKQLITLKNSASRKIVSFVKRDISAFIAAGFKVEYFGDDSEFLQDNDVQRFLNKVKK